MRHGFVEHSREAGLELRLEGIEALLDRAAGRGRDRHARRRAGISLKSQIYDIARESFRTSPEAEDEGLQPRDEWIEHHLYAPTARPEATFVALAGDDAIGYAKLRVSPARPTCGFHGMTAVRRAWRGRGVAGALKRAQIRWALANGLERLETTNELRNEPMQRVNLGLGFQPTPGSITLEGPLAS